MGLACESFVVVEMVCVVGLARLVSGVRRAVPVWGAEVESLAWFVLSDSLSLFALS